MSTYNRPLKDFKFRNTSSLRDGNNYVHELKWGSGNPETTGKLETALQKAGIKYDVKREGEADHVTITGEDELKKVAVAGGDFANRMGYEDLSALQRR